jgi:hypothetical protein
VSIRGKDGRTGPLPLPADAGKAPAPPGAQRHCTATAGGTENAQVAVHLTYTVPAGHALIGSFTSPDHGLPTTPAAGRPASRRGQRSRPSLHWPAA